jgi:hypothetical protein
MKIDAKTGSNNTPPREDSASILIYGAAIRIPRKVLKT